MAKIENASGMGEYAALIRRRRVWILTIVPAAILGSLFLAYVLPAEYRSTATIILEQSAIPQELIQTTVASYQDQQIEVISGRVMTLDTLKALVQKYDPYPDQPALDVSAKAQKVLSSMEIERVDPVTLQTLEKSPAFSLHYQNPDPGRAAVVTRMLADLFLTYHQQVRTEAAATTAALIQQRAEGITTELRAVDEQFAQLRQRYGDALPDARSRNVDARDRAERSLESIERDLRAAQERESALSVQLSGLSPNLLAAKSGDLTDLATVRAQLADAEQRYTPDHPDVKRLRRALASLMANQASAQGTPASQANNPEYRRVANLLDSARKEVAALEQTANRARGEISTYSSYLQQSPEVERQFNDLQRRRESLQAQYQQAQEKLKSAQMGESLEAQERGEHFSMIREPIKSSSPYSPNRLGLGLLGVVIGLALAAIAVAIAESSDPTVRGSHDLAGLPGATILGSIPRILRSVDQRRRRFVWGSVGAIYLVGIAIVCAAVVRAQSLIR